MKNYHKSIVEASEDNVKSSEKTSDKKSTEKVTADSIVNDLMKLEPSQLLKYIAKQEDSDAKAWIIKNILPFAAYVVKNGFIKAKALAGSVKDINKKNKEDVSGIDYDNVEIEESSIKTVYAFDEETVKKLQDFINDYKKQMEEAKEDIEKSSEKLSKDIKKSGIKIDNDKLSDNALVVAGVIDNKKNKGKSGKELTKIVDQKIENKKEFSKIQKQSEQVNKKFNKVKVNPKYEEMSIEQLEKLIKEKKAAQKTKNDSKEKDNIKKESIEEAQLNEAENPVSLDNMIAAVATQAAELVKKNKECNKTAIIDQLQSWVSNAANDMNLDSDDLEKARDQINLEFSAALKGHKVITTDTALKVAKKMVSIDPDYPDELSLTKFTDDGVKELAKKVANGVTGEIEDLMSKVSIGKNNIKGFMPSRAITLSCKALGIEDEDDLGKLLAPKSFKPLQTVGSNLRTFLFKYEKNPSNAIKFIVNSRNLEPERKKAYAELICKLKPEAISEFKKAGINIDGKIDKLSDTVKAVSDTAKSATDNAIEKATTGDTKLIGSALVDGKGRIFDATNMSRQINKFDNMADDGNIDPSEFKKISNFEAQLSEYQKWATENANSDDPVIQAKIAQIKYVTNKFNNFKEDCGDMLSNDEANAVANRILDAAGNSKEIAKLADNEQTKELTQGFWGKAGQMLKAFGQAKAVAKIGKFILNDGKGAVDAIGGQWMKFKEDQNVVAEMKFILMNGDDSKSNRSDTKFSVRFDTSDLKWHLTNLDDRKAKIEKEDVLKDKILNAHECKEFRKECIDAWTKILQPKDAANKFIPYFIKNYDKLGMKISDKHIKKYFDTLKTLADNFDEVKKQFA